MIHNLDLVDNVAVDCSPKEYARVYPTLSSKLVFDRCAQGG